MTYFAKPVQQIIDEFATHDLDTQYMIYLCGTQYRHPPLTYLARPFASQGEPAARYLREKLVSTVDDRTVVDIVQVFEYMEIDGTYDVRGDTPLVRLIEDKVNAITDPDWRTTAQELLDAVRGP